MRPLRLSIKGLHSFIEEQTIDFSLLTSYGLFGIFGPTGSGKSTILDGITLALYGEISRKSSTFINTNVDACTVVYDFQISDHKVEQYRVIRRFKRDKVSGNSRTDSAILIRISNGQETILTDKITQVTKACEKVIGLGLDDFTRTVVLPQGKFSEFLKLEGKLRRDMLERLFHLEVYGDELSSKLSRHMHLEKDKMIAIEGELKAYEDTTKEHLTMLLASLQATKGQLQEKLTKQTALLLQYKQLEQLYAQQLELAQLQQKQAMLLEQQADMDELATKIGQAEVSNALYPYSLAYETSKSQWTSQEQALQAARQVLVDLTKEKDLVEAETKQATNAKEEELPRMQKQAQDFMEAMAEQDKVELLQRDLNKLQEEIATISKNISNTEELMQDQSVQWEASKLQLAALEQAQDQHIILDETRQMAERGANLMERMAAIDVQLKKESFKQEELKQEINSIASSLDTWNQSQLLALATYQDIEVQYEQCLAAIPESSVYYQLERDVLAMQQAQKTFQTNVKTYEELKEKDLTLEKAKEQLAMLLERQIIELDQKQLEWQQAMSQDLAGQLRKDLIEGSPCPVCGSVHHMAVELAHNRYDLAALEKDVKASTLLCKQAEQALVETNHQSSQCKQAMLVQQALVEQGFDVLALEQLEQNYQNQTVSLEQGNKQKAMLEQQRTLQQDICSKGQIKIASHQALLVAKQGQWEERKQSILEQTQTRTELMSEIVTLQQALGEVDLIARYIEIKRIDQERTERDKQIKVLRVTSEQLRNQLETNRGLLATATQQRGILLEQEKFYGQQIQEKQQWIIAKVGMVNEPYKTIIQSINDSMEQIGIAYQNAIARQSQVQDRWNQSKERLIALEANLIQTKERLVHDQLVLDGLLKKAKVELEWIALRRMEEEAMVEAKGVLEDFGLQQHELLVQVVALQAKLPGESVAPAWQAIQTETAAIQLEIEGQQASVTKIETEAKSIELKLKTKQELIQRKQKLDHSFALYSDLEKLFKGKKFVEFAALSQLQYVAMEANVRLLEITNGTYGLEIDEVGKFIIRDYKNGGAPRDASTLSGGETFLASLSLALALSAQIQLKGTAPLELFFLDEGFGTLDEEYLEVVMSSLEKIHHEKLKVGIISHVESIKNRIPIKLILTPAIAGEGGSKVRIEMT